MKKRFYELDLCRVIACIMLPFVHIVEFWGDIYDYADILALKSTYVLNSIIGVLCLVGAPLFIICMGVNVANTSHNTPKDFLKRGIFLILVELILNLLRYEIPAAISLIFSNSEAGTEKLLFCMGLGIFNSDILALAGLAFILIALLKKLNLKPWMMLLVSVGLFAIDFILNETVMASISENMNPVLANILGNFIYIDDYSTFPLTEWFSFIAVGYVLGDILNSSDDKKESIAFAIICNASIVAFACCHVYVTLTGGHIVSSLTQAVVSRSMTPLCAIAEISVSLLLISILYWIFALFKLKKRQKFCDIVKDLSSKTTAFYIVQWVIIGWVMMFSIALIMGSQIMPIWLTLVSYVAIVIVSYLLANPVRFLMGKLAKLTHLN